MDKINLKMFILRENIMDLINKSELDLYPIYFIVKDIFEKIERRSEEALNAEYQEYCAQIDYDNNALLKQKEEQKE